MQIKLFINSLFPCVINIDDKNLEIDEEVSLIIDTNNSFDILTYPIIENNFEYLIPYSSKFYFKNGKINCDNPYTYILKLSDNTYQIIFKPYKIVKEQSTNILLSKNFNFDKKKVDCELLFDGEYKLKINKEIEIIIPYIINEYNIEKLNNNVFLYAKTKNNQNYLLFYDILKNKVALEIICDTFEIKDNLTILIKYNDHLKQGQIKKYDLDNLNQFDEYTVYLNGSPKNAYSLQTIPYVFLEGIKAKNYDYASSLLSENLSKKMDNQKLNSFFKDFKVITTPKISTPPLTVACLVENESPHIVYYTFSLDKNNKINNVIEYD
jgi:hypothetical protein